MALNRREKQSKLEEKLRKLGITSRELKRARSPRATEAIKTKRKRTRKS